MRKAYAVITDRIIQLLEQGTVPWHRPWGGSDNYPRNLVSGKRYRGINVFVLSTAGYSSPWWLTFKQAKERDGHVKKGERGWPCVYWNWREKENKETGDIEKQSFLRCYTVFNVKQCIGIPSLESSGLDQPFSPIEACERVVNDMPSPPDIKHLYDRAGYVPVLDTINMPGSDTFESPEAYYGVLFHEMIHSTGHEARLARKGVTARLVYGTRLYNEEELIAEMGSAFLCGHTGIEKQLLDNQAAYIESWLGRLKEDSSLVIRAASNAQKAADCVLGQTSEEARQPGALDDTSTSNSIERRTKI